MFCVSSFNAEFFVSILLQTNFTQAKHTRVDNLFKIVQKRKMKNAQNRKHMTNQYAIDMMKALLLLFMQIDLEVSYRFMFVSLLVNM